MNKNEEKPPWIFHEMDIILAVHVGNNSEKVYLFEAPPICGIEENQEIVVATAQGEQRALATQIVTLTEADEKLFNAFVSATGATLPLRRVLYKIEKVEMNYEGVPTFSEFIEKF